MLKSSLLTIAVGLSFFILAGPAYALQQTNATAQTSTLADEQQPLPLQQQQQPLPQPQPQQVTSGSGSSSDDNTTAIIGGTAAAAVGGVITALTKKQNDDKKKINNALRDIDHDKKEEGDAWTLLLERAAKEENKDLTFFQLLNQPVYPGNSLNRITLGENIVQKNREFNNWFKERYIENKD